MSTSTSFLAPLCRLTTGLVAEKDNMLDKFVEIMRKK